jgi:hypothetical protein
MSKAASKELIDVVSPLLQELVNYATNALARCARSDQISPRRDVDLAVLALYRHVIEVTDGIEVLLSQSCAVPAIPLLRSAFEAHLGIEYILQDEYERRSLSWLVAYIHERINAYESLDLSTNRGRGVKKLFEDDQSAFGIQRLFPNGMQENIRRLQNLLTEPHVQPVDAEYSKSAPRRPKWYQLFNGPANLRSLAEKMHRGGQYELLYRQWSAVAHAQDFQTLIAPTPVGNAVIRRFRDPELMRDVSRQSPRFILDATRLAMRKFRPKESLKKWYISEVRVRFLAVTKRTGFRLPPE